MCCVYCQQIRYRYGNYELCNEWKIPLCEVYQEEVGEIKCNITFIGTASKLIHAHTAGNNTDVWTVTILEIQEKLKIKCFQDNTEFKERKTKR